MRDILSPMSPFEYNELLEQNVEGAPLRDHLSPIRDLLSPMSTFSPMSLFEYNEPFEQYELL